MERENLRLHRENEQLKLEIQASLIREEIALVMPHLLKPSRSKKKANHRSQDSTKGSPEGSVGTNPSSTSTGESTT
jgi:hypothetical protein